MTLAEISGFAIVLNPRYDTESTATGAKSMHFADATFYIDGAHDLHALLRYYNPLDGSSTSNLSKDSELAKSVVDIPKSDPCRCFVIGRVSLNNFCYDHVKTH